MIDKYIMQKPYTREHHKEKLFDGFEGMIAPDGTIYFAQPSHQEFLIVAACELQGITREELDDKCPPEYYTDFLRWLVYQSGGFLPVWESFVANYMPLTIKQQNALKKLKIAGIYVGKIPV